MTILNIAVLSGLIMATALAGCSSSNYDHRPHADRASATDYMQPNTNYMPNHRASTSIGQVMTTPEGVTVYTFDNDHIGKSNCYAGCARDWPPVTAADGAQPSGRMSLASRTDGQPQWAYDGKPLYTYGKDSMHGDVKGDNVGNVWHVVR